MDNKDRENLICFLAKFQGGGEPSKDIYSRYPAGDLLTDILLPIENLLAETKQYVRESTLNIFSGVKGIAESQVFLNAVAERIFQVCLDIVENPEGFSGFWTEDRQGSHTQFDLTDWHVWASETDDFLPTLTEAVTLIKENPLWLLEFTTGDLTEKNTYRQLAFCLYAKIKPLVNRMFDNESVYH